MLGNFGVIWGIFTDLKRFDLYKMNPPKCFYNKKYILLGKGVVRGQGYEDEMNGFLYHG